ncbi:amino acid ABC transporter permease [Jatrophihabitans sp. YIM 134969]
MEPRQPAPIKAVPLRRPWRWISAVVVLVVLVLFGYGAATNDAYDWSTYGKYLFDQRVSAAALVTIELTVIAMVGAVVLGVLFAVMRLSANPVLRAVAWLYLWFFRGTPIYVQLVFWGLVTVIYKQWKLGIPFGPTFVTLDLLDFGRGESAMVAAFTFACIGLALNEAAYMAEIVRAGINSVDEGQTEAAEALGMTRVQTLRRIVLPQAMRVIIPPTGNEVISMLKTTSLVVAVPLSTELYSRTRDIAVPLARPVALLLVAATWYLAITSVLMVGQYFLERRFSRGSSRTAGGAVAAQAVAVPAQQGAGGG